MDRPAPPLHEAIAVLIATALRSYVIVAATIVGAVVLAEAALVPLVVLAMVSSLVVAVWCRLTQRDAGTRLLRRRRALGSVARPVSPIAATVARAMSPLPVSLGIVGGLSWAAPLVGVSSTLVVAIAVGLISGLGATRVVGAPVVRSWEREHAATLLASVKGRHQDVTFVPD